MNIELKVQDKLFEEQLNRLELLVSNIQDSILFLDRNIKGKVEFLDLKDRKYKRLIREVLKDYIVNNLHALLNETNSDSISLSKIVTKFKSNFHHSFFSEYISELEAFKEKYKTDLEKIKENRNLSTAHLGVREQLGWPEHVAEKFNELFEIEDSPIAQKDSLQFITIFGIHEMPIVQEIKELKRILKNLQLKFKQK